MNQKSNWETRYLDGSTGWDRGRINPQFQLWLDSTALKPCRILVPGCGNGYEVIQLAAAGFEVVALDIAPTPVHSLRTELSERSLHAEVLEVDVLQWESASPFDAIYEQTSLCALDPAQWLAYEQQLYRWLRPGGEMFTLLMQTNKAGGPPHHCDLVDMRKLFKTGRWRWSEQINQVGHPAGFHELVYILEKV